MPTPLTGETPAALAGATEEAPDPATPPLAPETQKIVSADRAFRLALLQSTETCKNKEPACTGGFQWKGYSELVSAARYAMNTGQLPPEALAMLKAALFKIDTAAPILEDKGLHKEILV